MKTYKHLFENIVAFDNLLLAAKKAQKGKRFKTGTARFNINLEREILQIRRELIDGTYIPGAYTEFFIYEPKKRMISAAPYRDRVVHHALCNVIEPIFDRRFIFDLYSNRKGKGTHRAVLRYQNFARKNKYVLKCDIRKFFPSIDHEILKEEIRRKIADTDALRLIDTIIDHSNEQETVIEYYPGDDLFTPHQRKRGLPMGNLTSQFFANIYLNRFDHFIKESLRCGSYLRYVDDWCCFDDSKDYLWEIMAEAVRFMESFRLRIHDEKPVVFPVTEGLAFLGHRVFPGYRLLKKDNIHRFRRKMKGWQRDYSSGRMEWEDIRNRVQSWNAHALFSDTYRLRQKLFSEFAFSRGTA